MGSAFRGGACFALFSPPPTQPMASTTEAKALRVLLIARAQHQDGMLHPCISCSQCDCWGQELPPAWHARICNIKAATLADCKCFHTMAFAVCTLHAPVPAAVGSQVAPATLRLASLHSEHAGLPVTFLHGLWIWRSSRPVRSMLATTRWPCPSCRTSAEMGTVTLTN